MHATSLAVKWGALVDTHTASTLGAKVQCLQSITSNRVKPIANPILVFAAMIEDVCNMSANLSDIEDEVVCLLFLRVLPDENSVFRQMLEREREEPTIDRLRIEMRAQYDLQKGGKSSSRSSNSAFLASGTRRKNSKWGGKPKKKEGGTRTRIPAGVKTGVQTRAAAIGRHPNRAQVQYLRRPGA